MSQTQRALLCAAACFVLGFLFFFLAEWYDRRGRIARLFAEAFSFICMCLVAIGSFALISIGMETGHLARAYHLVRDHRGLTPMLLALVPMRIR